MTEDLLRFLNAAPSPFHAVHAIRQRLQQSGEFQLLSSTHRWQWQVPGHSSIPGHNIPGNTIAPGGRYWLTTNGSCLCAFVVGSQWRPGNGQTILAAHTDSPCLKVKPISSRRSDAHGYRQLGVQTYGGGLWHTWFDRDLGLAGRVVVESNNNSTPTLETRLVRLDKYATIESYGIPDIQLNRPILKIPSLAIHLDRSVNEEFKYNKETHLTPVLSLVQRQLNGTTETETAGKKTGGAHPPALVSALAKQIQVDESAIRDMELCLYDVQPATLGGMNNEFVFSARLDNLMMSYCCIEALLNTAGDVEDETHIRMVLLFDNEEVGSESAQGAASNFLESILRRLHSLQVPDNNVNPTTDACAFERSLPASLLISADMAHAIHPNYAEKHESQHQPRMNEGLVLKHNANQRYATSALSASIVASLAAEAPAVPLQQFVVRNDSPCGSTIGPIVSAKLGLKTVDVGIPQLSMHSIREMCGIEDVASSIEILGRILRKYSKMEIKE